MSTSSSSDELLAMFERFDTGTVSDALDRLAMVGAIQSVSRLTTDRTVVGYAVTVQLGPDDGSPSERHLCTAAIEAGDDRSVIVVAGGRLDCGGWGGLLSRAASYKGIRGVIVDGASRDVDEAAAIGLPVFARRAACATARGRQREVGSGEPVVVDGVRIAPGDVVVADGSGLVVVPRADALRVVEAATAIHEREQEMAARIGAGETVSAVLGGNYESMLNRKE